MTPVYQYNIGDIIETHDDEFGMITDLTNAHDYMAFEHNVTDRSIRSYMNIPIYKVLINGNISYVNESNIRGTVEWEEKKKKL